MSLFGSIYEDAGGESGAPPPAIDVPAAGPAPGAVAPPISTTGASIDPDAPIEVPVPAVATAVVAGPAMSLQDFAAEVFGTRTDPGTIPSLSARAEVDGSEMSAFATMTDSAEAPGGHPASDLPPVPASPFGALGGGDLDAGPTPPPTSFGTPENQIMAAGVETSPGSIAALTHTDAPPDTAPVAPPGGADLPPGNDGAALGALPEVQAWDTYQDDLLPGRRPSRSRSVPSLSGRLSGRSLKTLLVLGVVVVVGLFGLRSLRGGGDDTSIPARQSAGDDANVVVGPSAKPGDLGSTIGAAQIAAAEAELRSAALQASAYFAEAGSFAQPATAWQELLVGSTVAPVGGTPQEGTLQVVSDDDAVCFETLTGSGSTVAVGVTATSLGFASDASGAAICTTDAATLAGWAPSLIVPAG